MRKDMKVTDPEYRNNPLYRKMKDRFAVNGQVTIGDFMRSRARRDGYPVSDLDGALVVALPAAPSKAEVAAAKAEIIRNTEKKKEQSRVGRYVKNHLTILACLALFLCIAMTLVILIPVCNNLAASAMGDTADTLPAPVDSATEPQAEPAPAAETHASFENILSAFNE